MFGKVFRMEMKRGCSLLRLSIFSLILLIVLFMSSWKDYAIGERFLLLQPEEASVGSASILTAILSFNRFTVLAVLILSGMHGTSFSKDDSNRYLRMILTRTDIAIYTKCCFLSNMIMICLTCLISFSLFVILLLPAFPIIDERYASYYYNCYYELMVNFPFLFVAMMAFQLGMIAAACSSIGLLYSAYQPSAFVSICLSGFIFYILISFFNISRVPMALNVEYILSMTPCLGERLPWYLNYAWGILLPGSVVAVCTILFYRRLKWRRENGEL